MSPAASHPRARSPFAALAFLLAVACAAPGCSASTEPPGAGEAATSNVTLLITVEEPSGEALSPGPSAQALRAGGGTVSAQGFSFSDVTSIRVDVKDAVTGNTLFINFDLVPTAQGWSGLLPSLPQNRSLTFSARAFNASGTLLFSGTTTQTLATDRETVGIAMVPANDGATITLPRIKKISIPGDFVFGQSGNITFFVESTANEPVAYTLSAAPTGGGFQPASGSFTMPSTAGAFVVRYVPPFAVATPTEFTHELKLTNQAGHSVSTTFKTRVVPPDNPGDSLGTTVRVVFNPVINSLDASRALGTDEVTWTATVADDGPAEALTYAWSFAPSGTGTPLPSFTAQANPTVMQGYTVALQGMLTLSVTDGAGGTTTARYVLGANHFPDQPGQDGGATDVAQIRAGGSHTCALLNDGTVRCWGLGSSGQLGYGNGDNLGDKLPPYTRGAIPLTEKVVQLATGGSHTCALTSGGFVRCWGLATSGQLGYGNKNNIGDTEPVTTVGHVNLGARAVRIAAGANHTCALLSTGRVRCWGLNGSGQLGLAHTQPIGDDEDPSQDVQVGAPVQDLVTGTSHTCALLFSGKVRCWGVNTYGQLGITTTGPIGDSEHPDSQAEMNLGALAVQLTAGSNHTCALLETQAVRCWGYNGYGQLGNGSANSSVNSTPFEVNLGAGNKALQAVAGDNHTCALLGSGLIKCWGNNGSGQLGYGNPTSYLPSPPAGHTGLSGIPAYFLTAGDNHTCALLTNGRALCWGSGASGRLGYGNVANIGDDELPGSLEGIPLLSP
ncbi:RTX toxin [Pyxidicoccus sp. 3LG]